MTDASDEQAPPPTFWQTAGSVLAAFFGVQNSRNRRRDFTRGKPSHYILMGAIATALFVVALLVIVRVVLAAAGV